MYYKDIKISCQGRASVGQQFSFWRSALKTLVNTGLLCVGISYWMPLRKLQSSKLMRIGHAKPAYPRKSSSDLRNVHRYQGSNLGPSAAKKSK
jgi:hypothetical protein